MTNEKLIAAIIAEVKKVLTERGIPVASGTAAAKTFQPSAPSAPSVMSYSQSQASTAVSGGSDLSDKKVITQKDLEGISSTRIQVAAKAVITPLAVDYARANGITIDKVAVLNTQSNMGMPSPQITVALAFDNAFKGDRTVVTNFLSSKGFALKDCGAAAYESSVNALTSAVASGQAAFGICVENSGMGAPIFANRNKAIRAAHVRNNFEARAARVDFGANVLVLDAGSDPASVIAAFCGME